MVEDEKLFLTIDAVTAEVLHEVLRAKRKFLPFNSAHEGYAVLLEEVDELWDEVKKNQRVRVKAQMRKEAIQCAAMAVRFVLDVCDQARPDDAVDPSARIQERRPRAEENLELASPRLPEAPQEPK